MPDVPEAVLINYPGASLIQVVQQFAVHEKSGGGQRDSISGFSRESRRRMMNLLNRIERSAFKKAKLITLTYHRNEQNHKKSKYHLKRFIQEIRRHYPDHAGVWKLEYQERGAIHYHVLSIGRFIPHETIARTWTRIAEPGNDQHLASGTEIRCVRDARNGTAYVSKYIGKLIDSRCEQRGREDMDGGKEVEGTDGVGRGSKKVFRGRFWGVFNRKRLPLASPETVVLEGRRASEIQGYLKARYSLGGTAGSVVSVYTGSDSEHQKVMEKIYEFTTVRDGESNILSCAG